MNKKRIIGIVLGIFLVWCMFYFLSDWILNLALSLVDLSKLVQFLEMPHKFYGLTIMLFISWKMLEAVINLWIKGIEKAISLIKNKDAEVSGAEQ